MSVEFKQYTKQLWSLGGGLEIKTDQFGPYNPHYQPVWVLKMMRRDPVLALGLRALKAPLMRPSRYFFHGGDPEARAFLTEVFRQLLPKFLRTALNALDFGFQAHEIVWDESLPTVRFRLESGSYKQLRKALVPKKLVDLDPDTVTILVNDSTQEYEGLSVGQQFIPANKTLLISYDTEFGNLRGRSIQLPAYNAWWWSNVGYQLWGRFMERMAAGVYVARAPGGHTTDKNGVRQDNVEFMTSLVMTLRALGVVTIPSECDSASKTPKWGLELLESRSSGEAFERWQIHLTAQKLRGILIPDRLVTQDGTGSFAAHESSFEQFFQFSEATMDEVILRPLQKFADLLVELNYGSSTRRPELRGSPMDPKMRKAFFELFKSVRDLPREVGVKNGAVLDVLEMLKQLDVPVRDQAEWPRDEQVPPPPPPPPEPTPESEAAKEEEPGSRNPKGEREFAFFPVGAEVEVIV